MVQSSNDPRKEAAALKSRVGNNVGDPWTSAFWTWIPGLSPYFGEYVH